MKDQGSHVYNSQFKLGGYPPKELGARFLGKLRNHPDRAEIIQYAIGCAVREGIYDARFKKKKRTKAEWARVVEKTERAAATYHRNKAVREVQQEVGRSVIKLLDRYQVGNKALGDCTKSDLQAAIAREEQGRDAALGRITFYQALLPVFGHALRLRDITDRASLLAVLGKGYNDTL